MFDDEPVINKPLIGVAIAVLIAAGGGIYYWYTHKAVPPEPAVASAPPPPAPAPEDTIAHPVPATVASADTALPALNDSDAAIDAAVGEAAPGVSTYLVPTDMVRHIVVTVDNLLRQKVAVEKRPVTPVAGGFVAAGDELHATLDAHNFKRYEPLVRILEKVDMQRLVASYLRFYPLFQKAYQDLGYPNGYFNDRLVQVIDALLATPQLTGPVELARPNVMYVFADPALEALPAGQKLLIRMGPDNETAVKAKLTELRADIIAATPKH